MWAKWQAHRLDKTVCPQMSETTNYCTAEIFRNFLVCVVFKMPSWKKGKETEDIDSSPLSPCPLPRFGQCPQIPGWRLLDVQVSSCKYLLCEGIFCQNNFEWWWNVGGWWVWTETMEEFGWLLRGEKARFAVGSNTTRITHSLAWLSMSRHNKRASERI